MPRTSKSQWEFGELFAPEQIRSVLTVSDLTLQVKRLLTSKFSTVWVSGEISNLRRQASGHCYLTLKDAGAQLACVLFRGELRINRDLLEDGRKVLLQGELTVYELRGQYQLVVKSVELQGIGALQIAFERLKQKLQGEGLFASERKRPLPIHPERIGVVTSATGAALRDVLHVIQRRQPSLEVVLAPCRVQGEGAGAEIAAAIRMLNTFHHRCAAAEPADSSDSARGGGSPPGGLALILVTRGGGSLEDLWAFNEEVVARAIFESALPVVSAVGHEIDFTISDFVADLRAATPSAAAELITQGTFAAGDLVREAAEILPRLVQGRCDRWREQIESFRARIARAHPRRRINEAWQRFDDLLASLARAGRFRLREARNQWEGLHAAWARLHPRQNLDAHRQAFERTNARFTELTRRQLVEQRQHVRALVDRLRLLSPEHTLARGYSITTDAESGRILRSVDSVHAGQTVRTRIRDGTFNSRVEGSTVSSPQC